MFTAAKVEKKSPRPASPAVLADELLAVRCLRNERAAWVELFELCQGRIITRVRSVLRRAPWALETAEEVAAQVWLSIIVDDGRLLRRFAAGNGTRIATYLSGIASMETLKFLRSARRRKHREAEYGKVASQRTAGAPSARLELEEFLSLLTPAEHSICLSGLQAASESPGDSKTRQTAEKAADTRRSVRRKLARFFQDERGTR